MFHTYRRLCTRLGAAMLCQFFLINVLMSGVVLVLSLFADSMDPRTYNLIDQLVYAALYLAGFMLPVLFFRLLSRGETAPPPDMTPALTWRAIPFVFAVIGANLPCAYLNSLFMQLLSSMGISNILDFVEMPGREPGASWRAGPGEREERYAYGPPGPVLGTKHLRRRRRLIILSMAC